MSEERQAVARGTSVRELFPFPMTLVGLGLLLAASALPHVIPIFYTFLAIDILILALFGLSLNLLLGYTGMVSFGHAAYLA